MPASRSETALVVGVALLAGLLAGRALNPAGRPSPAPVATAATPREPAAPTVASVSAVTDTACPPVAPAGPRRAELLVEISELEARLAQLQARTNHTEGAPLEWSSAEVEGLDALEGTVRDHATSAGFELLETDCGEPPCLVMLAWGVGEDPTALDQDRLDAQVDALTAALAQDDLHGRFCASATRIEGAQAEVALAVVAGRGHPSLAYHASQRLAWRCKNLMGF